MAPTRFEDGTEITDHLLTLPEKLVIDTEASTLENAEGQGPAACLEALRQLSNDETGRG